MHNINNPYPMEIPYCGYAGMGMPAPEINSMRRNHFSNPPKIQDFAIIYKWNKHLYKYSNKNPKNSSKQHSYGRLIMVRMTLGKDIASEHSAGCYSKICYLPPLGSLSYIKQEKRKMRE